LLFPTSQAGIVNQLASTDQIDQYHSNSGPEGQFVARRHTVGQQPGKRQSTNQKGHAAEIDEASLLETQHYLLHVLMTAAAASACSARKAEITTELRNVFACSDINWTTASQKLAGR
jgi:hypothetical protein